MDNNPLSLVFTMISSGKITELEAERLLNAATRFRSGTPTGASSDPAQQHKHLR